MKAVQKEPKTIDDIVEKNKISIIEKDVNSLIAEADTFILEQNLTLPSEPSDEKQKLIAQTKIDKVTNLLNTLETEINALGGK